MDCQLQYGPKQRKQTLVPATSSMNWFSSKNIRQFENTYSYTYIKEICLCSFQPANTLKTPSILMETSPVPGDLTITQDTASPSQREQLSIHLLPGVHNLVHQETSLVSWKLSNHFKEEMSWKTQPWFLISTTSSALFLEINSLPICRQISQSLQNRAPQYIGEH